MQGPDFIIIGAMKCATSTLQTQLSLQPGIFMTTPKEPNFFSDDEIYELGTDWYESLFDNVEESAIKGEASTHYTKLPTYPHTVDRIRNYCSPQTRFIYVMRNPLERLVSHYIHEWSQGNVGQDIDSEVNRNSEFIDYSKYYMQLQPYIDTFGPDNILPVFYERLIKWPQPELERVTSFLGYTSKSSWKDSESKKNVSSERIRKFPGYDFLIKNPIMTTIRRNIIPTSIRKSVKSHLSMDTRPQLSSGTRQRVIAEIDADLEKLSSYLGMSLNCENFSQQVLIPGHD